MLKSLYIDLSSYGFRPLGIDDGPNNPPATVWLIEPGDPWANKIEAMVSEGPGDMYTATIFYGGRPVLAVSAGAYLNDPTLYDFDGFEGQERYQQGNYVRFMQAIGAFGMSEEEAEADQYGGDLAARIDTGEMTLDELWESEYADDGHALCGFVDIVSASLYEIDTTNLDKPAEYDNVRTGR